MQGASYGRATSPTPFSGLLVPSPLASTPRGSVHSRLTGLFGFVCPFMCMLPDLWPFWEISSQIPKSRPRSSSVIQPLAMVQSLPGCGKDSACEAERNAVAELKGPRIHQNFNLELFLS